MNYSNASLIAPRMTKPHIAKREGWWRVSPLKHAGLQSRRVRWSRAHDHVARLNTSSAVCP